MLYFTAVHSFFANKKTVKKEARGYPYHRMNTNTASKGAMIKFSAQKIHQNKILKITILLDPKYLSKHHESNWDQIHPSSPS